MDTSAPRRPHGCGENGMAVPRRCASIRSPATVALDRVLRCGPTSHVVTMRSCGCIAWRVPATTGHAGQLSPRLRRSGDGFSTPTSRAEGAGARHPLPDEGECRPWMFQARGYYYAGFGIIGIVRPLAPEPSLWQPRPDRAEAPAQLE